MSKLMQRLIHRHVFFRPSIDRLLLEISKTMKTSAVAVDVAALDCRAGDGRNKKKDPKHVTAAVAPIIANNSISFNY